MGINTSSFVGLRVAREHNNTTPRHAATVLTGTPCGCEQDGLKFCNFDYGSRGKCGDAFIAII